MAIFVNVRSPQKLLDDIKSLITIGEIQEWTIDDDGDFTLSDERLKNEAWQNYVSHTVRICRLFKTR